MDSRNVEFEDNEHEAPASHNTHYALLVGINSYADDCFKELKFCVNDVEALGELLKNLGYIVRYMHDKLEPKDIRFPKRVNINKSLNYICQQPKENDLLLIYFACHGMLINNEAFLIMHDTILYDNQEDLKEEALAISRIKKLMNESKASKKVLILDACHTGIEIGRAFTNSEFIESVIREAKGFAMIAASTARQVALELDEEKHGLFTYYLLEGLKGGAEGKESYDRHGYVTVQSVYNYVLEALKKWYIENGTKLQEPTFEASGLGPIALAYHPVNIPIRLPKSGAIGFIGRENKLEELHRRFQENQLVAIIGMAGVGKTELALQYAEKYKRDFRGGICWIWTQDQQRDIATQIVSFVRSHLAETLLPLELDLQGKIEYLWSKWDSQSSGNVLLILDGVDQYAEIKDFLPFHQPFFKILITSRRKFGRTIEQIELNELSEDAAIELLELASDVKLLQSSDEQAARQLCTWIGRLPLGLELVGRYLYYKQNTTLEQVLQQLKEKCLQSPALSKEFEENDNNITADMTAKLGVEPALELSWQLLKDKEQEIFLSYLLSLFSNEIAWSVVEQVASDLSATRLVESREELCNLSLLKRISNNEYRLHELIRTFFQEKVKELVQSSDNRESIARYLNWEALFQLLQENPAEAVSKCQQAFEFSRCESPTVSIRASVNLAMADIKQGKFDMAFVRLRDTQMQLEGIIQDNQQAQDHQQIRREKARILANLARIYVAIAQFETAVQEGQQAIDQFGDLDLRGKAQTLLVIGNAYSGQADLSRAEDAYRSALKIFQDIKDMRGEGQSLNNLAKLDVVRGQFDEANQKYHDALALFQRIYSLRDQAESLRGLGILCEEQGRVSEAILLLKQALKMGRHREESELKKDPFLKQISECLKELYQKLGLSDDESC